MPYAFFVDDEEITGNLEKSLEGKEFSTELVLDIIYQEQAVFKVRPITRCTRLAKLKKIKRLLHICIISINYLQKKKKIIVRCQVMQKQ